MAAPEQEPHIEEHTSFIRTPKQLAIVVLLAFVVPLVVLIMLAIVAVDSGRFEGEHPALTEEKIAQRIRPVGQVQIGDAAPVAAQAAQPAEQASAAATTSTAAATGGTQVAAATPMSGKAVYDKFCMACHAAGVAGAPKLGDKAAWEPRLKQGTDHLYASALKGKGAMPPKGGATQLSDAEVKASVDFMLGPVK